MRHRTLLALTRIAAAASITCPLIQDGRIPQTATTAIFDTSDSPFDTQFVKGTDLTFSSIITFPCSDPTRSECVSRFSNAGRQAIEISISDASIFTPGGSNGRPQLGFRRAELLLKTAVPEESVARGQRVYHWSARLDARRMLNLSHDYLSVFHELADSSGRQWEVRLGTLVGASLGKERLGWRFAGKDGEALWRGAASAGVFDNFAVGVDYERNRIRLWHSKGDEALTPIMNNVANDNTGGGQWHIGIVKHPTDAKTVVFDGYQEAGIDEGLVYAGVFLEDGSNECISS